MKNSQKIESPKSHKRDEWLTPAFPSFKMKLSDDFEIVIQIDSVEKVIEPGALFFVESPIGAPFSQEGSWVAFQVTEDMKMEFVGYEKSLANYLAANGHSAVELQKYWETYWSNPSELRYPVIVSDDNYFWTGVAFKLE